MQFNIVITKLVHYLMSFTFYFFDSLEIQITHIELRILKPKIHKTQRKKT